MSEQVTQTPATDSTMPQQEPEQRETKQKKPAEQPLWVRICKRTVLFMLALPLLVIICLAGAIGFLQTESGQSLLEEKLNGILAASGIAIHGLAGSIPLDFSASVRLADENGTWLEADNIHFALELGRLPDVLALSLEAEEGALSRLPGSTPAAEEPPSEPLDLQTLLDTIASATEVLPDWVPAVEISSLRVGRFAVARAIYDQAFAASIAPQETAAGTDAQTGTDTAEAADAPGEAVPAVADADATADKAGTAEPAGTKAPVLDKNAADAIAVALHGSVQVFPGAEKAWADPDLGGDISLFLLPLQHRFTASPADTADPASTPQAEEKTLAAPATGIRALPLRTIIAGTDLDAASCTLVLSGTLSAPQLALETRAGAVHTADMTLKSPSLRLALPGSALGSLRTGETASVLLAASTQLDGIPLALRLQLDMQLLAESIRIAVSPQVTTQGFLLAGSLQTALGKDFTVLPKKQADLTAQAAQTAGTAPAVQTAAAKPATAIELPDLEPLLPPLDGQLAITVDNPALLAKFAPTSIQGRVLTELALTCQDGRQRIALNVQSPQLAVASNGASLVSLKDLHVAAGVDSLTLASAGLALNVQAKDVKTSAIAPISLTLKAAGTASDIGVNLVSTGGVQAHLDSRIAPLAGRLSLARLDVSIPEYKCGIRSQKEARCTFGETNSVENLSLALLPAGRLDLAASMSSTSLTAKGSIRDIDTTAWTSVVPGLPEGRIDAQLDVNGSPAAPAGTVKVRVADLVLPVKGLPPLSAALDASLDRQGAAKAQVTLDQTTRSALGLDRFVCEVGVPLKSSNGSFGVGGNAPLRGNVDIAGTVSKLWLLALQPNRRLTGNFTVNADISGTLSQPVGKASVLLKGALFKDVEFGIMVREINTDIRASFAGSVDSARVDFDITAKDGRRKRGSFALRGSTNLKDITAKASLDQFAPLRRRDIRAVVSADCTVSGPLTAPQVNGKINVDRGRIQLDALQLPASVTTLPLVEGPKEAILASRAQAAAAAEETKTGPDVGGSLNLTLGVNKFFVNGYGFDSEWKASMLMNCPLSSPGITGQVEAVRGNLDLLNKRFTLDEGTVKFAGGFEPLINVQMSTSVNDIEASVVVGGTPAKLSLNLTSKPTLPRNDILAYMLFGKPANELSQFELLRLGTTAASFAAFGATGGSGAASIARRITGLDVLNLSQNDGSTQLEMGSYVMDKVYVGIKQGTEEDSDTAAVIQIELGPRTSATMETGSGSTSAGLKWKMDY